MIVKAPFSYVLVSCLAVVVWLSPIGLGQELSREEELTPDEEGSLRGEDLSNTTSALTLQRQIAEAIRRAERSVVAIARVRRETPRQSEQVQTANSVARPSQMSGVSSAMDPDFVPNEYGAGVVIDRAGLILTTYHVLGEPDANRYVVWSLHRPFEATLVAADPWYDLAVLRVSATDLVPIAFGNAKFARKGHFVVALGNPQAIAADGEVSASWGIVSNRSRRAPRVAERTGELQRQETLHHHGTLIQTDARLNGGYSGGALVDLSGEMIGLLTSYTAGAGFDIAAGYAIPVDTNFLRAVEVLKTGEQPEFGFLGAASEPLAAELRQQGVHGVRLVSVIPGTPAAAADLRVGDVITQVNDRTLYDDDDLFRSVGGLLAGTTANLRILRGVGGSAEPIVIEANVVLAGKASVTVRSGRSTESR